MQRRLNPFNQTRQCESPSQRWRAAPELQREGAPVWRRRRAAGAHDEFVAAGGHLQAGLPRLGAVRKGALKQLPQRPLQRRGPLDARRLRGVATGTSTAHQALAAGPPWAARISTAGSDISSNHSQMLRRVRSGRREALRSARGCCVDWPRTCVSIALACVACHAARAVSTYSTAREAMASTAAAIIGATSARATVTCGCASSRATAASSLASSSATRPARWQKIRV